MKLGENGGSCGAYFRNINILSGNDIQATYVWIMNHTVMCNAVGGHVDCLNVLVWTSEPRKSEGEFEYFSKLYLILVPDKKFIEEKKRSENIHNILWTK